MAESDNILEVDTPVSLLPDLAALGIEEVDNGVCEDTFENRRTLRDNKYRWQDVYNLDGTPTQLIRAISPEMMNQRIEKKKAILTDDRNTNSDYVTGYDLITNPYAKETVPGWVLAATRQWLRIDEERQVTGNPRYRPAIVSAPGRCIARKLDGSRCLQWHNGLATSADLCRRHISAVGEDIDQHHIAKARNRLRSGIMPMLDVLEDLAINATSEPVREKAAETWLDRAGVRAGIEIDQKVEDKTARAGELLAKKLAELAPPKPSGDTENSTDDETVVAEVIEDDDH